MKHLIPSFYLCSFVIFLGSCTHKPAAVSTPPPSVSLISQMRQLTFVGPRAGEGYFSADGRKMVFQSEREPGNPFYQIYLMDLETGESERVSTGSGKTTCAWIHPEGRRVLFASTHEDPKMTAKVKEEYAQRKSLQKAKYSWSFDEEFEIYERTLGGGIKRLTTAKGYDAEGSYSPDGQWIAFASNRSGYTSSMTAEERKLFEQDPSAMMEIYVMKADGSQTKRLTNTLGYDGGPFFSADGKKITWRRFAPNGQSAEIYTMNVDGTEQKPLTHLKAMSWAPFFHPSGDYLVFTTNTQGFSNFELYIVDAKGLGEPVRVSNIPDFDGLPVFSPDGDKISWTHRNEKGESQIYMANWDDQKARQALNLTAAKRVDLHLGGLAPEVRVKDVKHIIDYLASPEQKGRRTGSPEEKIYTKGIAEIFSEMGLGGLNGKMVHPFSFTAKVEIGDAKNNTLEIMGLKNAPELGKDFMPISFSKVGSFPPAPIAFAGYGIVAAATEKEPAFDSFKSIDIKGKWVLILRDVPENVSASRKVALNVSSRLQHKVLSAQQKGAVGVLVASGNLQKLKFEGGILESRLPVISITDELASEILAPSGRTLAQWKSVLDTGETQATDIPKSKVQASVDLKWIKADGQNVLAKIAVKGATETLVIGAHGDHLGLGDAGNSLAKTNEQGQIHFGADDNASGVAAVIELAHYYQTLHRLGKIRLKQNLVFAVWSGEEIGVLGSADWLKTQTSEKISAYINMDMIGRYRDKLMVQGAGSAKEWKQIFEELAPTTDLELVLQDDPYLPSDSLAFYLKKIPGVMFFTGAHGEYHSPRDLPELINLEGEVKIIHLVGALIRKLSEERGAPRKLTYIKAESSHSPLEGRSFRVYLGTIPDYAQEGVRGVKISGTSKDSPAEKAGLAAGDVIVELSGLKIENLYDYVYGLQSLKAQQPTQIHVQRSGKLQVLSITPMLKE